MATVPKIGAVTAALLVFSVAFGAAGTDRLPLMWTLLAGGSIVVGNLVALRQTSYTRMLGYSGIAQIGYVLVGFAASSATASAVLVLISAYGFAASAAFLGAEAVAVCHPDWDGSIAGMAGMGRTRPILGIALTVAMFSLTGMPLTLGFWGKLGVFGPAVASGDTMLVSIAAVGILGSVVSFGYYGGVLRTLFFETPAEEESPGSGEGDTLAAQEAHAHAVGGGQRVNVAEAVAAAIGAFVLVLGVYPLFEGLDWLMGLFA
jgi:NADH-quinone oxidoreductase subunit N